MGRAKYILQRLFRIDTKRLSRTISVTAEKSGRSRARIALDMLGCALKYTAAPADYALFEFWALTPAQRATYVTRGVNDRLVKKYNDRSLWHIFDNKDEFNTLFARYAGREWLRLDTAEFSAFEKFLEGRSAFFYKPLSSSCGWGVEKIELTPETDKKALFAELCGRGPGLAEEQILQHEEMNRLFPGSVNTVRLVTIRSEKETAIVFAFLRAGNGRVVDNLNSGGMAAPIDPETGVVTHPAADKDYMAYACHPATGTAFVGFKIPRFEEAKALVLEAAQIVPRMGYVGWDIAVTPEGLCLVEANSFPGHDILQLPPHVPDKIGLMDRVRHFL